MPAPRLGLADALVMMKARQQRTRSQGAVGQQTHVFDKDAVGTAVHKRQLLNDGTTKAQRRDEVSVLCASAGEVDCTNTHVRVDV